MKTKEVSDVEDEIFGGEQNVINDSDEPSKDIDLGSVQ